MVGVRLTQENLEQMTEKERKALVGRIARDYSENKFGVVMLVDIRKNRGYEVTFTTNVGCGKYTFSGEATGNLFI